MPRLTTAHLSFDLIKRILLSVLVAVYIVASIIAGSPYSPLTGSWTKFFKPTFNYLGLFNNFGVFSPDPAKYNQEFRAVIKFQDGKTVTWKFPSLLDYKNDDVMKQLKLPWVEWEYYFVWDPQNVVLLPDAAKYIAYIHRNPSNQPVQVDIYREHQNISVPGVADVAPVCDLILKYPVEDEDIR
ncbi:MAG: hypothetical protein K2X29_12130 [Candidatus Obscuribacterales bacterium]|nr:hypothetical protein [Candidatus Obscuribacterales bacterium]